MTSLRLTELLFIVIEEYLVGPSPSLSNSGITLNMGQFTYQSITTLVTRGSPVSGVKVEVIPSVSVNPVWPSQQTLGIDLMLVYYWPTVYDVGPTINQHSVSVSCFLSYQSINWCTEKLALSYLSTALIGWSESTGNKLTGSVGVCYRSVWVTRSVRGCYWPVWFQYKSWTGELGQTNPPFSNNSHYMSIRLSQFELGVLVKTTFYHATYYREVIPCFCYWSLKSHDASIIKTLENIRKKHFVMLRHN